METPDVVPHTFWQVVWLLLASGLGIGGSQWFNSWKNRRIPVATIHLSESQADLARAQATQTLAQTLRMISEQQKEATTTIAELQTRDESRSEYVELLELQLRRAKATFLLNGIVWDEKAEIVSPPLRKDQS